MTITVLGGNTDSDERILQDTVVENRNGKMFWVYKVNGEAVVSAQAPAEDQKKEAMRTWATSVREIMASKRELTSEQIEEARLRKERKREDAAPEIIVPDEVLDDREVPQVSAIDLATNKIIELTARLDALEEEKEKVGAELDSWMKVKEALS